MLLHGHPSFHVEPPNVAWTPPTPSRSFADDVFETVEVSLCYFKISMGWWEDKRPVGIRHQRGFGVRSARREERTRRVLACAPLPKQPQQLLRWEQLLWSARPCCCGCVDASDSTVRGRKCCGRLDRNWDGTDHSFFRAACVQQEAREG